jgi:enoyl-CoA hydratase/carnithine racemase
MLPTAMSINFTILNGVATIEIARPEKKNALTAAMYQSMAEAIIAARADTTVLALLIIGQPGIFTAGNDLADFMANPPTDFDAPVFRFMRALLNCEKPVMAAVTGAAIGIGTTLLLHCDLVYVAEDARFAMPFTSLGLVPEFASSLLLPQLMGRVQAAEKLLLGEPFNGVQAVALGLANAALPAAEVIRHGHAMAERFNQLPAGAVRESKRLLHAHSIDRSEAVLLAEANVFIARLKSPEAREAFQAFFDKRRPDFSRLVQQS